MLEETVNDYSAYFKIDVLNGFQTVQDVVDNMLTRLEELTSVLQIIKLKNSDCSLTVSEDISKYRSEINTLSKKISTLCNVIKKMHSNVDAIEKQMEKAEIDFGVHSDNKIKKFLMPFLTRNNAVTVTNVVTPPTKLEFQSVLNNFEDNNIKQN